MNILLCIESGRNNYILHGIKDGKRVSKYYQGYTRDQARAKFILDHDNK